MSREEMIDGLVEARIKKIFGRDPEIWIECVMRYGAEFKPYKNMTDEEIAKEYEETFEEDEA